jgi:hypothetical protein
MWIEVPIDEGILCDRWLGKGTKLLECLFTVIKLPEQLF